MSADTNVLKPVMAALIVYVPAGTELNTYSPTSFVWTVLVSPVCCSVSVTSAPGMTPFASFIEPRTPPRKLCAPANATPIARASAVAATSLSVRISFLPDGAHGMQPRWRAQDQLSFNASGGLPGPLHDCRPSKEGW